MEPTLFAPAQIDAGTDFDLIPNVDTPEHAAPLPAINVKVQPVDMYTGDYDGYGSEANATPQYAPGEDDASVPGSPAHQQPGSPRYTKAMPPSPGSQGTHDSDDEPDGPRNTGFDSFGYNSNYSKKYNNEDSLSTDTTYGTEQYCQQDQYQQPQVGRHWPGNPQAQADAYQGPLAYSPTSPNPAILTQTAATPTTARRSKRQREVPKVTAYPVAPTPCPAAQPSQDLAAFVTEHTYLELHAFVASNLCTKVSDDNPRNFKYLDAIIKKLYISHPIRCIPGMKNLKQKFKSLYTERRRETQLKSWRKLAEAAGIPKAIRNVRVTVNEDAVRANAPQVHAVMHELFQNTAVPRSLVALLADHVVERLASGQTCPSSILEMEPALRDAVLNVLLAVHNQPEFGTRFHLIYHRMFEPLFAVADIEQAILASCNCESCVQDWELENVVRISDPRFTQTISGRKTVLENFRQHWNRQKAIQFHNLLELHINHNGAIPEEEVVNMRRCRGWNADDLAAMVPATHEKTKCSICSRMPRKRRSGFAHKAPSKPVPVDLSLDGAFADDRVDAKPKSLVAGRTWYHDLLVRFAAIGLTDAPAMD